MKQTKSLRVLLILLFVATFGVTSLAMWGGPRSKPPVPKAQGKTAPAFKPTKFKPACVNPSYPMPAPTSKAKLPVRVTGQLYFDSSHFPCSGGQGAGEGNPKRVALWEIHPIYKFEVCTADCDGAGQWVALDKWAQQ